MAKVAGSIWVEGNNLHFIDQFNREWQNPGSVIKAVSGAKAGSIWIDPTDHLLYFVNEAGNGIYRPYGYGDAVAPLASKPGSLWIGADNQIHWITTLDATQNHNVRAHYDQATVNTHTDTHSDTPHQDTIHNDVTHNDVPAQATHGDWHLDDPHHDFSDQFHGDHTDTGGNQNFNDFSDHIDYPWPDKVGTVGGNSLCHDDYRSGGGTYHRDRPGTYQAVMLYPYSNHDDWWNHNDIPHGDVPHGDSHRDSPHVDEAAEYYHDDHQDSTPHTDVPHTDIPHGDGHSDTHADTHGDTPHYDEPYLIGP